MIRNVIKKILKESSLFYTSKEIINIIERVIEKGIILSPFNIGYPHYFPLVSTKNKFIEYIKRNRRKIKNVILYVHYPFCKKICPYCVCPSLPLKPFKNYAKNFLNLIENEVRIISRILNNIKIINVHFGGGTPQLLEIETLHRIIKSLKRKFSFDNNIYIEIEIYPDKYGIDKNFLKNLKDIGFNYISLGVESLRNSILKKMERRYTKDTVLEGIKNVLELDLSLNIDLIIDYPEVNFNYLTDLINLISFLKNFKDNKEIFITLYNYSSKKRMNKIYSPKYSFLEDITKRILFSFIVSNNFIKNNLFIRKGGPGIRFTFKKTTKSFPYEEIKINKEIFNGKTIQIGLGPLAETRYYDLNKVNPNPPQYFLNIKKRGLENILFKKEKNISLEVSRFRLLLYWCYEAMLPPSLFQLLEDHLACLEKLSLIEIKNKKVILNLSGIILKNGFIPFMYPKDRIFSEDYLYPLKLAKLFFNNLKNVDFN